MRGNVLLFAVVVKSVPILLCMTAFCITRPWIAVKNPKCISVDSYESFAHGFMYPLS